MEAEMRLLELNKIREHAGFNIDHHSDFLVIYNDI